MLTNVRFSRCEAVRFVLIKFPNKLLQRPATVKKERTQLAMLLKFGKHLRGEDEEVSLSMFYLS